MSKLLPLVCLAVLASASSLSAKAEPGSHSECVTNPADFMALDYWTFDQNPELGWRMVAEKEGCDLAAADLIADYHAMLREKGEPISIDPKAEGLIVLDPGDEPESVKLIPISPDGEVSLLYWHEGQLRAFAGETDRAVELFLKTVTPEKNSRGWHEYALGSVAFLQKDKAAFEENFDALRRKWPDDLNFRVLDRMNNCFEESYVHAYSSLECQSPEFSQPWTNPASESADAEE